MRRLCRHISGCQASGSRASGSRASGSRGFSALRVWVSWVSGVWRGLGGSGFQFRPRPAAAFRQSLLSRPSLLSAVVLGAGLGWNSLGLAQSLVLYSFRQPHLIEPVLDSFTAQTGVEVKLLYGETGLLERIAIEGERSPADLILTSSHAHLELAVERDLVASIPPDALFERLDAFLRDPDRHWVPLTKRMRVLFLSKERVPQGALASYEALADPAWRGKICMRKGMHPYNISLFAFMIEHLGDEKARQWMAGLKANLARRPQGNDRAQVKAVWQGECDVAIGNSYYYGRMLEDAEQRAWAEAVRLVFPDPVHVNISGIAMTKASSKPEAALALIRFLLAPEAQAFFSEVNHEYPVTTDSEPSDVVKGFGRYPQDSTPLVAVFARHRQAIAMLRELRFDQ